MRKVFSRLALTLVFIGVSWVTWGFDLWPWAQPFIRSSILLSGILIGISWLFLMKSLSEKEDRILRERPALLGVIEVDFMVMLAHLEDLGYINHMKHGIFRVVIKGMAKEYARHLWISGLLTDPPKAGLMTCDFHEDKSERCISPCPYGQIPYGQIEDRCKLRGPAPKLRDPSKEGLISEA